MKFISAWEYSRNKGDNIIEFYYDIGILTVLSDGTVWDNWINGESVKSMHSIREKQYPIWKRIA